jgi:hypothetical protein
MNEQSFWLQKNEHNEHNQLFPKISPVSWLSSEQKLSTPLKRKKICPIVYIEIQGSQAG